LATPQQTEPFYILRRHCLTCYAVSDSRQDKSGE